MEKSEISNIAPNIKLLHLHPPIPGYDEFIGPYLLSSKEAAVIDTGPASAVPSFMQSLRTIGMNPDDIRYIIFTHIHIDHAGSAGTVAQLLRNAKVIAHARAHEHLSKPKALWEASLKVLGDYAVMSGPIEPVPENRIIDAVDGMKVNLDRELTLEIYLTPGHASHHLCVFFRAAGLLFTGEAAGVCINGAVRLATPPPFKLDVTLSSIDKLIELGPTRLCYSHFGCYDNGLERLKLYREKVERWYEVVNAASKQGKNLDDILKLLRAEDRELAYLDHLEKDIYARELSLIYNSIRGLTGGYLPE
jgi:glyoxylase-like metal-dependent hydrolase (beta-lactamase superfamily II)